MESLLQFQANLLEQASDKFIRGLYHNIDWNSRMIGIRGLRGVGKTTLLLQRIKYGVREEVQALYVTADHPYFYSYSLFELADEFYKYGGRHLFIDEVHKYANWSSELKNIYDGFPLLRVVFTASSALDMYRGSADLSRRVVSYELHGLSFREFLLLDSAINLPELGLEDVLNKHSSLARNIKKSLIAPLREFDRYLKFGYLPFFKEENEGKYLQKLFQVIDATLIADLAFIQDYSAEHIMKIKRLLGVLSESAPFVPNISSLAQKLHLGRDSVNHFLYHLQSARILNLVHKAPKGVALLQKPDKVYLENTNFSYALKADPDKGALREVFFLNQLLNAGHMLALPEKGDFIVNDTYIFEIGGKTKRKAQINAIESAYIVSDDIEIGYANKIPLWLFGFLY